MTLRQIYNALTGDFNLVNVESGWTDKVANYAALPTASLHDGEVYVVLNNQGTAWLPGSLGGTFYAKGFYISTGGVWEYLGATPYQATQAEVNTGTATDVFVSPSTLANSTQWSTKEPSIASGSVGQYWSYNKTWQNFASEVRGVILTGYTTGTNAVITAADTILTAFQNLQKQISDLVTDKQDKRLTITTQTGSYSLVSFDANTFIKVDSDSPVNITVASGIFTAGDSIIIQQYGAGQITFAASGVTFRNPGGKLKTSVINSIAVLIFYSSTEAAIGGDLTT